jgi:anti-anti-sigma factor
MADEFRIERTDKGASVVFRVHGRLDAKNAETLRRGCQLAIDEGHVNLVLNLSNVVFVASSGIGSLLALTETCRDAGGSLWLAPLSNAVASVIDLLNLRQFLSIEASEGTALAAVDA